MSKTRTTIIIAAVIIAMLAGSIAAITLINNPQPPTNQKDNKMIVISYVGYSSKTIPWTTPSGLQVTQRADEFKNLIQLSVTIQNEGYDTFNTNASKFKLIADNIKYDIDPATGTYSNWDNVEILNNGTYIGFLIYQIPEYIQDITLSYDNPTQNYNIAWDPIHQLSSLS